MSRAKNGQSMVGQVRALFAENKDLTANDIVEKIGVSKVAAYNLLSVVRKEGKKKRRQLRSAAEARAVNGAALTPAVFKAGESPPGLDELKFKPVSNGHYTVEELVAVKKVRDELGGFERLNQVMEALVVIGA